MTIKDLKEIISNLPDDALVLYADPSFTGAYHEEPVKTDFKMDVSKTNEYKRLLISFPLKSPVE